MKDTIILEKVKKKKKLLEGIADITILAEVTRVSILTDLAKRYK